MNQDLMSTQNCGFVSTGMGSKQVGLSPQFWNGQLQKRKVLVEDIKRLVHAEVFEGAEFRFGLCLSSDKHYSVLRPYFGQQHIKSAKSAVRCHPPLIPRNGLQWVWRFWICCYVPSLITISILITAKQPMTFSPLCSCNS